MLYTLIVTVTMLWNGQVMGTASAEYLAESELDCQNSLVRTVEVIKKDFQDEEVMSVTVAENQLFATVSIIRSDGGQLIADIGCEPTDI